jgi:hypothetical protein
VETLSKKDLRVPDVGVAKEKLRVAQRKQKEAEANLEKLEANTEVKKLEERRNRLKDDLLAAKRKNAQLLKKSKLLEMKKNGFGSS